jgi:hypothetical protein
MTGLLLGAAAVCRFDGCGQRLKRGNVSGVCADHSHRAGFCGCRGCAPKLAVRFQGQAVATAAPRPAREGIRVVVKEVPDWAAPGTRLRRVGISLRDWPENLRGSE